MDNDTRDRQTHGAEHPARPDDAGQVACTHVGVSLVELAPEEWPTPDQPVAQCPMCHEIIYLKYPKKLGVIESLDERGGRDVPVDLFDAIARHLFAQTALITAPGAVDPRWPAVVAQAYREGIAAYAGRALNGVLFKLEPDGMMSIHLLE